MSAAENLKPAVKGEHIASVLSSKSPKFPGDAEKVLKKAGYTVVRFMTLDELLNAPVLGRPGFVILEIEDEDDIQQAHIFLRTQESAIALGRLKAVIFTSIKHQDLRKRFQNNVVAEFLIHPTPDRTFVFKMDLQAKILSNVLEAESKRTDVSFELHSAQQKSGGRYNIKVIGPAPTRGGWQVVASSPTGGVRWRWVKKPIPTPEELAKEVSVRDWQYEGKEPPTWDEKEQLWNMEAEEPVLEKIEQGQKTFSSKTEKWLARNVDSVRKQTEEELGVTRSTAKVFFKNEPMLMNRGELNPEETKKELSARTSDLTKKGNLVVDIGERSRTNPTPNEKPEPQSENTTFPANETQSSIMDLRSEEKSKSKEEEVTSYSEKESKNKANTAASNLAERGSKIRPAETPNRSTEKDLPKDQASALREKFRDKQTGTPAKDLSDTNKKNLDSTPKQPENIPVRAKPAQQNVEEPVLNKHDLSKPKDEAVQLKKERKIEPTIEISAAKKKPVSDFAEEVTWKDRREEGKFESPEIRDRRSETTQNIQIKRANSPTPEVEITKGSETAQPNESVIGGMVGEEEKRTVGATEATKAENQKALKQRDAKPQEEKTAVSSGTATKQEEHLVRSEFRGKEDEMRARSEPHVPEVEIRVRGALNQNQAADPKNPLRVVKERVHYLKTLEELGDDNSTWERAEIYRIYLGAKKKYYGIETIEEALPIWVYIGESAPEYVESLKSWKFFDNIPVKYTDSADLPEPILNLLLDLRNRVQQQKLEELRRRNSGASETPAESAGFQPLPRANVPAREIKLKAANTPAESVTKLGESKVEHVRVETFADKVFSLLINLFRSGRK